jgi:hypothetical protein
MGGRTGRPRATVFVLSAGMIFGLAAGLAGCGRGAGDRAAPVSAQSAVVPAPADVMPSAKDLGAGWRRVVAAPAPPAPDWPWALPHCVLYRAADYPATGHREAVRRQSYAGRPGQTISVTVERFRPGWAARSMDDVRRVLDVCVRYEYSDASTDFLDSHTMTLEAFAGDDSLLVETVRITTARPADNRYTAVVRRGELVITIVGVGVPQVQLPQLARLLASRA